MKKIIIKTSYITLGQFLKISGIIQNGGEAKFFLSNNKVLINNSIDQRRGRKLYRGDIIKIKENEYLIQNEN